VFTKKGIIKFVFVRCGTIQLVVAADAHGTIPRAQLLGENCKYQFFK
jgi:hypothetical protein